MRGFIPEYLAKFYDELTPQEFYRAIFPEGELEERGIQETGKYNAIAVELLPKAEGNVNARRHIITDDLRLLDDLLKSDNFIIISPISYAGRSRVAANARFIYAITIDLDGITEEHYLTDLFFQMRNGFIPEPTYIVSSGTGIHLYYQLEKPLPCFKNIVKQLAELKKALTKKIWNRYTTELYNKPQVESLFQGFRMVGGITKNGKRTRAFQVGKVVSIDYLNDFVEDNARVKEYAYKSKLTLAEAKKKYPEWYQARIVEQKPRGVWTTKRDLFDWWVRQIKSGAAVGHRYFCIMVLAIYAKKAGIDRDELEETAFELVKPFDSLSQEDTNRFTREDVLAALEMYNDNYITFPIDSIVNLTDIPIEKNKRNYRTQKTHLRIARATKEVLKEVGEMKPEGSPSKEQEVIEWRRKHPNGSKSECMNDTGISKPTVYKYWEIASPKG
jgi:hypothetical protein